MKKDCLFSMIFFLEFSDGGGASLDSSPSIFERLPIDRFFQRGSFLPRRVSSLPGLNCARPGSPDPRDCIDFSCFWGLRIRLSTLAKRGSFWAISEHDPATTGLRFRLQE